MTDAAELRRIAAALESIAASLRAIVARDEPRRSRDDYHDATVVPGTEYRG